MTDLAPEYVIDLGLEPNGEYIDGVYTLTFADSDSFQNAYNALDNDEELVLVDTDVSVQRDKSSFLYVSSKVSFLLTGDFDNDIYTLEVREIA